MHVKTLLKALLYTILWFNCVIDVVNVVMFNLVSISDTTNEFPLGENKDLLK